jgi:single-strand DNA-binding protein
MSIEAALFGTLGRDAELKTSAKGKPYLRANIAVSEGEATTWVNAMIFDQAAIDKADKLIKGARIYLEGRLQLSEWTDRDGKQRHGLSIMSWHCRLSAIGRNKPSKEKSSETRQAAPATTPTSSAGVPFDDPTDIPF